MSKNVLDQEKRDFGNSLSTASWIIAVPEKRSLMSSLLYKNAAENSDKCHDRRKDKGQTITPCLIEDHASHICPEAPAQMVDGGNKTRKKTDMRESI